MSLVERATAELGLTMTAPEDAAAALDRVLQLAALERGLRNSPAWKSDLDGAVEAHGAACDRLWDELYRLLDARERAGKPVSPPPPPVDQIKELRKAALAHLRAELPAMIAQALDELT